MISAFFGMLIISVWYGTRMNALTISTVTIKGGETIPHEHVDKIVREKLEGTYLKLVPRAFAFTYPHDDIETGLREIKRIKNLSIVRLGGTEVLVEFDEYLPHALWCAGSNSEGCFFLDDTGYSFSPAPSLTGGSFMRFVAIGRSPSEHAQAFSSEEYQKLQELVALLAETGWYVERAEVDGAGDAFLSIVDGGEFKVTLKQEAKETVDNLTTVLNSEKFSHIKPGNFEYIDLRFGEKVFVNEVTLETTASSTLTSNGSTTQAAPNPAPALSASPSPANSDTTEAPASTPDTGVTITF
jgi:cell division septal protein FtsQ